MVTKNNIQRPKTIIEKPIIFPNGTQARKKFGKHVLKGEVKRYNNNTDKYWIDYENGTYEEMDQEQLERTKAIDRELDQIKRFARLTSALLA